MDDRAVDSCCFVEDLQGPSSNCIILVAAADINSNGSLKSQHRLDPDGVSVCKECGFRMFLHRRKPAAPVAPVPPPPPRTIQTIDDVQECGRMHGVNISPSDAKKLLHLNPHYYTVIMNPQSAAGVVEDYYQFARRALTSTRHSFTEATFIALNGPYDAKNHPKLVTGTDQQGAPVIVKFVDPSSSDMEQRRSAEMEIVVCRITGACPHLVPCNPQESRAHVEDRRGVTISHSQKIGIVMPHFPVTAARSPPLVHSLLATKLRSIIGALLFLHERQIVHMDVKPFNIFVDLLGVWRLGDFDACCMVGERVRATTRRFHLTTTDLYNATFRHDWGMLLCTTAVLMNRRSGDPEDSSIRIELDPSRGTHYGELVPRARDVILEGATDELREVIAEARHHELEGIQ